MARMAKNKLKRGRMAGLKANSFEEIYFTIFEQAELKNMKPLRTYIIIIISQLVQDLEFFELHSLKQVTIHSRNSQ